MSSGLFLKPVDNSPVRIHIHDGPASCLGFVESFVQFSNARGPVVCPLTYTVGVVSVKTESRTGARTSPLQHLQITVRISKSGNGPPADECLNSDRLAFLVIDKLRLGQLDQHRLAVSHFKFQLALAADHLF